MTLSRSEVRRALFVLVLMWILATGPRELAELGAALSTPRFRALRAPARAPRPLRAARRERRASAAEIMRARRR